MDELRSLVSTLSLLLLRIGLPLVVTLLVSYLLARLDDKWRAEELTRNGGGLAPAARPAPKCWVIKGCDPALSAACPVRALRPLPCWIAQRQLTGRVPEECFRCPVFVNA